MRRQEGHDGHQGGACRPPSRASWPRSSSPVSRAIGETMVATMAGGRGRHRPCEGANPLEPGMTMTGGDDQRRRRDRPGASGGARSRCLFFVGLLLFLVTLAPEHRSATASCGACVRSVLRRSAWRSSRMARRRRHRPLGRRRQVMLVAATGDVKGLAARRLGAAHDAATLTVGVSSSCRSPCCAQVIVRGDGR